MGDVLPALSIPVLVFASGIYAACESGWRRRHPAPPSPYTHQAARLAERGTLMGAEDIVEGAYERLGGLYDSEDSDDGDIGPGAPDTPPTAPGATRRASTGPDSGRSAPAPARRG